MPLKLNCYLAIPVSPEYRHSELSSCARKLLTAALRQAEGFVRRPVSAIGVMAPHGDCYQLKTKRRVNISRFFRRGTHLFLNTGLLLSDTPPIEKLVQKALKGEWAWCGQAGTGAFHAMAFHVHGYFGKSRTVTSPENLRTALLHLTACAEQVGLPEKAHHQARHMANRLIPPGASGMDYSPAMEDVYPVKHRRTAFDPRFINTAFREATSHPAAESAALEGVDAMATALLKHRNRSAVPWIFNAMINEIEYRTGAAHPKAFPPEIHLSTVGACNINCRFCNYDNAIARQIHVLPEQIQKMVYLKNIQTLRLSSGLGEPTLNPHLPEIIYSVCKNFPHIQLGFFSNGLALHRNGLLHTLVGNVNWINISLNAATAESYRLQCHMNGFKQVTENLARLLAAKKENRSVMPLVMGSMVLNRGNLSDLPKMPGLCRRLGIDRLTIFPFSALGSHDPLKFGPEDTLAACMQYYGPVYEKTVKASERSRVSLEIPTPGFRSKGSFGISERIFFDFAQIESNQWPFGRFLTDLKFENTNGRFCDFLWRYASIGSTNNTGHAAGETHFIYPCVGPLSSVDLSRRTAFRFQGEESFMKLWRHPVLNLLRQAQHGPGLCGVCDLCRNSDVRDPRHFKSLEAAVARFATAHGMFEGNVK